MFFLRFACIFHAFALCWYSMIAYWSMENPCVCTTQREQSGGERWTSNGIFTASTFSGVFAVQNELTQFCLFSFSFFRSLVLTQTQQHDNVYYVYQDVKWLKTHLRHCIIRWWLDFRAREQNENVFCDSNGDFGIIQKRDMLWIIVVVVVVGFFRGGNIRFAWASYTICKLRCKQREQECVTGARESEFVSQRAKKREKCVREQRRSMRAKNGSSWLHMLTYDLYYVYFLKG